MSSSNELMYQRLDEVRMSQRERMRARAHLERAEAVAEQLAGAMALLGRLFRLLARPLRRVFAHAG
jgi:hypothetical protein